MTADSLLADLTRQGFFQRAHGNDVQVAPFERLTDAQRETIRENKGELLALFRDGMRQAQKCRLPRWSRHLLYPLRQRQLAWKPRYPSDRPRWQSRRQRAVGLRLKRAPYVTGFLRVPPIVTDARSFTRPDQTTSVRARLWVATAWFIRSATRPIQRL